MLWFATSLSRKFPVFAEYNDGGSMTGRYVHGVGADTPYVWYQGSTVTAASRRYLFANWQGSISLITNATGFTVLGINAYDAYGIPNATNIGRFQYSEPEPCRGHGEVSQIWLPELGLYHYKARIYSPTLGRFLQTDPIGYEDQVNLYAYVGNDPVNMVDPDGKRGNCAVCKRVQQKIFEERKQKEAKAREDKARRGQTGSTIVGHVAAAKGVITDAAARSPGGGATPLKAGTAGLTAVSVVMDAKSQADGGKKPGAAAANAGGGGAVSAVIGLVGAKLAAPTLGGSLVVAGAVIVADQLIGKEVGQAAEKVYNHKVEMETRFPSGEPTPM